MKTIRGSCSLFVFGAALLIGSGCASVNVKSKRSPAKAGDRAESVALSGFTLSPEGFIRAHAFSKAVDMVDAKGGSANACEYHDNGTPKSCVDASSFSYLGGYPIGWADPRYAPYASRALQERALRQALDEPGSAEALKLLEGRIKANEKLDEEQEEAIGSAVEVINKGAEAK
jgi:hypothetical protein